MKCKRLLKFYFYADSLNAAMDRLITAAAVKSCEEEGCGDRSAERILSLIDAKIKLGELWSYIDGIMTGLTDGDRKTLEYYGGLRAGLKNLDGQSVKDIKRVCIKFSRRARFIDRFGNAIKLVREYYCLLDSSF